MSVYLRECDIVKIGKKNIHFSITQDFNGLYGGTSYGFNIKYKIPKILVVSNNTRLCEYGNMAISSKVSLDIVHNINRKYNKNRITIVGANIFDIFRLGILQRNGRDTAYICSDWARDCPNLRD